MGKKGKKGKGRGGTGKNRSGTAVGGGFTSPATSYSAISTSVIKSQADDAFESGDTDRANELLIELYKRMPAPANEHNISMEAVDAESGNVCGVQSLYSLKVEAEDAYGSGDIERATQYREIYLEHSRLRREAVDGDNAVNRGDYQLGREKYRTAFELEKNSDPWTTYRYFYFMNYTENIVQQNTLCEADVKLLTRIFHSETEPSLFQASASFALAQIHSKVKHDFSEACEYYRLTIRKCNSATTEEKRRIALTPPVQNNLTVETLLGMLRSNSQERLSILTKIFNDMGPCHTTLGGEKCDCCGKTCEQLNIPSLQRCSRCMMAYFCSNECFRMQWNKSGGGHKKSCRKPGQFEIGDHCMFGNKHVIVSDIDTSGGNPKPFKVVSIPLEDAHGGEFIIQGQVGGDIFFVSADELERTRPADVISNK